MLEMSEKARWDLHFFSVVVSGRDILTPREELHGRLCRFVEELGLRAPHRRWLEVFRGGLKSSLATIDGSCQCVARNPEERVLIISATLPLSQSFLSEIKGVVMGPSWRLLYPELRPDTRRWNDEESSIRIVGGQRRAREASWKAAGVETAKTGGHFSRIVYDDLVTEENAASREQQWQLIRRFMSWRPLVARWQSPELLVGTPYYQYDLYAWLLRERPGMFHRFQQPVVGVDGRTVWPDEFPEERLEELRRDMGHLFYGQMMLSPRDPSHEIVREGDRRWFRWGGEAVRQDVDWMQMEDTMRPVEVERRALSFFMACDPALGNENSDETAVVVAGSDGYGNVYIAEVVHGLLTPAETIPLLFELRRRWNVLRTWVETQGVGGALLNMLESEMRVRGEYFFVEKAEGHGAKKVDRISATLGPLYRQRRVYHHQSLYNSRAEKLLLDFPHGRYDDVPDALETAVALARKYGRFGAAREDQVQAVVDNTFGLNPMLGMTREEWGQVTMRDMVEYWQEHGGERGVDIY